ncbi:Protein FAR1-RELATED SEQUENCE 5 [Linum perenne]
MSQSLAYKYRVHTSGGHDQVGFTNKDVHNQLYRKSTSKDSDHDVKAALSYLDKKKLKDAKFVMKYTKDDEGRLENIFWTDSMSITDYTSFGEVLAFDTTYKKNAYNMPLVVFSGVNHHFSTCIFGSALLKNETETNYVWVLETLCEAMGGKKPHSVITDGDKAMKNAIIKVFPDATRRLCLWHINKNVGEHVKKSQYAAKFIRGFFDIAKADLTEIKFEQQWSQLVESCDLQHNNWIMKDLYECRENWAHAYLRAKFFAGLTTTSRCEGFNSQLAKYVERKHKLKKFFLNYDRWLEELREKEIKLDFKSNYGMPDLRSGALKVLTKSVATIFTNEVFIKVKEEIEKSSECIKDKCTKTTEHHKYAISMYGDSEDVLVEVTYDQTTQMAKCSCSKFEYMGLPCCHIMFVLKEEKIQEFPSTLVKKRWTKNPKAPECLDQTVTIMDEEQLYTIRYGILQQDAFAICHYGAMTTQSFIDARLITKPLSDDLINKNEGNVQKNKSQTNPEFDSVKNPLQAKSKGSGKKWPRGKPRICGRCGGKGHTRTTCKVVLTKSNVQANIEDGGDVNNIDEGGAVNDIDMIDDNTIDIDDDDDTSEEENDDEGLHYNSPSDIEEQVHYNVLPRVQYYLHSYFLFFLL